MSKLLLCLSSLKLILPNCSSFNLSYVSEDNIKNIFSLSQLLLSHLIPVLPQLAQFLQPGHWRTHTYHFPKPTSHRLCLTSDHLHSFFPFLGSRTHGYSNSISFLAVRLLNSLASNIRECKNISLLYIYIYFVFTDIVCT